MDPGCNHIRDRLSSPLWRHVPDAFDSDKVESVVTFSEPAYLSVGEPGAPGRSQTPLQTFYERFSSIGWNCSVCIPRVLHHAIPISQDGVNPLGALSLHLIDDVVRAFGPSLN